jgi:hypothetical protein
MTLPRLQQTIYTRYHIRDIISDTPTCLVVLGEELVTGEPIVVKHPKR